MKQLNTLKQPATSYADKLLDSLRSQGVLDTEQQEVAERLQKKNQGQPIAQTLIDIGISEESVQKAVADLFGMLFIHITSDTIDFEFVKTVGSGWCREHGIVPVCIDGKRYLAAQSPDAVFLAEDICSEQCANMGHAIALRRDLENAVDLFDSQTQKIQPEVQEEVRVADELLRRHQTETWPGDAAGTVFRDGPRRLGAARAGGAHDSRLPWPAYRRDAAA